MMKDQINLLPPAVVQQRNTRLYLDRLGTLLHRLQIMLVGLLVLIAVLYTVLERIEQDLRDQVARERPVSETEEARVAQANTIIALVHTHAQQYPPVAPYLAQVTRAMPPAVQLTGLAWSEDKRSLVVTGTFDSRNAITTFKAALEQLPWVEQLDAPLSNFATGPRPTFTFTLIVAK